MVFSIRNIENCMFVITDIEIFDFLYDYFVIFLDFEVYTFVLHLILYDVK